MFYRGELSDPVTEIEYVWARRKYLENELGSLDQCIAARQEQQGIKISLYRHSFGQIGIHP